MSVPVKSSQRERGAAIVEFALCSLFWLPLLFGTIVIGVNLVRATEVTQLTRDAGHMFGYGVDFSLGGNQQLLVRLAPGLGFTLAPDSNGVMIFSSVMEVYGLDCQAGGLAPNSGSCPNLGKAVFTRQVVVGNAALRMSNFGTPSPSIVDPVTGMIGPANFLVSSSAVVNGLTALLAVVPAGQTAFLTESYFSSPDLNIPGFLTGNGVYSNAIF